MTALQPSATLPHCSSNRPGDWLPWEVAALWMGAVLSDRWGGRCACMCVCVCVCVCVFLFLGCADFGVTLTESGSSAFQARCHGDDQRKQRESALFLH